MNQLISDWHLRQMFFFFSSVTKQKTIFHIKSNNIFDKNCEGGLRAPVIPWSVRAPMTKNYVM